MPVLPDYAQHLGQQPGPFPGLGQQTANGVWHRSTINFGEEDFAWPEDDVPPAHGVYVHVDAVTRRVLRIGRSVNIRHRWNGSHRNGLKYWFDPAIPPGTHSYPAFFRYLQHQPTLLYCWVSNEPDEALRHVRVNQVEQFLITNVPPAWETFRTTFKHMGNEAIPFVNARNWDALLQLMGPLDNHFPPHPIVWPEDP